MVIVVYRANMPPGKVSEALEVWKRHRDYYLKQPGVESCVVMRPLQGPLTTIMGSIRCTSLAAWEELMQKRANDPAWEPLREDWIALDPGTEMYLYQVAD